MAEERLGSREGSEITGWWPTRPDMFARLVEGDALILGIVGGYVHEGGRILDGCRREMPGDGSRSGRCAYLFQPFTGDELAAMAGVVDGPIGHVGMYVTPSMDRHA